MSGGCIKVDAMCAVFIGGCILYSCFIVYYVYVQLEPWGVFDQCGSHVMYETPRGAAESCSYHESYSVTEIMVF